MVKERRKRIYLNKKHTKFCVVRLFKKKIDMQKAYEQRCPQDKNHYLVLGCHNAYDLFNISPDGVITSSKEIGTVFLNIENCGAGIVSHEFAHAIFWAWKHNKNKHKNQHPIVIKSMREEEQILHNLTYTLNQFYTWYWKIIKDLKK